MQDIDIVFYYPQMNGITTSLFDTYFNLSKYVSNIHCYIFIDCNNMKENMKYIKTINKSIPINKVNYEFCNTQNIYEWQKQHHSKNLIVSFAMMKYMETFDFQYDNLIMLDSGLMFYDKVMNNNKKNSYIQKLPNISILGNPCNKKFFTENYHIYYHKFSETRLNYLMTLGTTNDVFNELDRNIEETDEIKFKNMKCNELKYQRWRNVIGNIYSENIGKMIFEFLYMGKKVFYSAENKSQDDGLTTYLKLFGIDDNINQELHLSKTDIKNKLGFSDKDLIWSLLI